MLLVIALHIVSYAILRTVARIVASRWAALILGVTLLNMVTIPIVAINLLRGGYFDLQFLEVRQLIEVGVVEL